MATRSKPSSQPPSSSSKKRVSVTDLVVGRNIRTHRLIKGLTQAELGAELGLTFQQVQKYEKGSNRVHIETLMRLTDILKVSPLLLLPKSPHNANGIPIEITALLNSPETIRLVREFDQLDGRLRFKVVELIEEMNKREK